MANNNEPRTFEEYNFQEFLKMKKENETLKNDIKQWESDSLVLITKYQELWDLVKVAFVNSRVEQENYTNVYINGNFVGLFNQDKVEDNEQNLVALAKLIKKVNALPKRE